MARTKTIEEELQSVNLDFFFGETSPKPVIDGKVILDRNNSRDVEWYENDEGYDV